MKFQIIYADPPWTFQTRSSKGKAKSPEQHYPCMTIEDIKSLPVDELSARNACLLLWVTGPHLPLAFDVIKAWGFEYKSMAFVWAKRTKISHAWHWGCGYWTRQNAEICLLATKGHPHRVSAGVHQIVDDLVGPHSVKPGSVRSRIEALLGDLPRVELFARQSAPGWYCVGNGIDGLDIRESMSNLIAAG